VRIEKNNWNYLTAGYIGILLKVPQRWQTTLAVSIYLATLPAMRKHAVDNHGKAYALTGRPVGFAAAVTLMVMLFLSFISIGQDPYYRTYNSANGLAGNEVFEAIQDSEGFMWFCTNRGVSRFDGRKFTNFNTSNGLGENSVIGIYQGKDGKIWCRGVSGSISYIENNKAHIIGARIPTYYANSLITDDNNNLWVGSQSGGVYYQISPPYLQENLKVVPTNNVRLQIVRIGDQVIYSRGITETGAIVTDSAGRVVSEMAVRNVQPNLRVKLHHQSYCIVSDDSLYISKNDSPLKAIYIPGKPQNAFCDDGAVWVMPSEITGAVAISDDLTGFGRWIFKDVSVSSAFKDREGGHWFCTLGSGVRYVPSLETVKCNVQDEMIPRLDKILISSGKVFFSATNLEILALDISDQIRKASETEISASGILRVKSNAPQIPSVKNSTDEVILVLGDQDVFIQENGNFTACSSLNCFEVNTRDLTIEKIYSAPSRINAFIALNKDSLLLGCNDGLRIFSGGNYTRPTMADQLSQLRINDLAIDHEGTIFAATSGSGVAVINNRQTTWIKKSDGLISDQTESICHHNGLTYVGTNNGLTILRKDSDGKYITDNRSITQSLPESGITDIAVLQGNIIFATDEGIFKCPLKYEEFAAIPPGIAVIDFTVNGLALNPSQVHELSYAENNIVINLASLSFIMPGKNRIRYMLSGSNDKWEITEGGEIRYASLSPGNYEFTARAENAAGVLSEEVVVIRFHIEKPFWLTWWFITLLSASLVALISILLFLKLRKTNRIALEQEALKTKAARMEMRALRSQMNPHFIFNSINSIQHYILNHDRLIANKMLSSFAKLMRNVLENSAAEFVALNKELETLQLYILLEQERFESKFTFTIQTDEKIDPITTQVPPMIIQPFVENAILHGLVPLKNQAGELIIRLKLQDDFILCTVEDNGIGRERSTEINKSKKGSHQSHGIQITTERLHLCYQSIGVFPKFDVRISDLKNAGDTNPGTKTEIMLPIQKLK
jgi:ligand-binding sensor domain-containing protein